MSKEIYFRQPKMWKTFRCLEKECPSSCCERGWDIGWHDNEISAVENADVPDEIKQLCKTAFAPADKPGFKNIIYDSEGRCPFRDKETGLCNIQRSMGLKGLGETCRWFPRLFVFNGPVITRCFIPSCSGVMKLLASDEHAMESETILSRDKNAAKDLSGIDITRDCSPAAPATFPKFFDSISDFYTKLFCGDLPFETVMILGATAAANIASAYAKGQAASIPSVLTGLLKQTGSENAKAFAESVTPDVKSAIMLSGSIIKDITERTSFSLPQSDTIVEGFPDTESYEKGLEKLKGMFDSYDRTMKNIALSLMMFTLVSTLTLGNKTAGLKDFFGIYAHFTALAVTNRTCMVYAVLAGADSVDDVTVHAAKLNTHLCAPGLRMSFISEKIRELGLDSLEKFVRIIK